MKAGFCTRNLQKLISQPQRPISVRLNIPNENSPKAAKQMMRATVDRLPYNCRRTFAHTETGKWSSRSVTNVTPVRHVTRLQFHEALSEH